MKPDLPQPNPEALKAAHQAADDAGFVGAAFPPAEVWQKEFPDCYSETPDGKFNVAYRNQRNTAEQNQRNSQKVQALIGEWVERGQERSRARDAALPTVRVRGMDGTVMHVPATMEKKIAARGTMRPAIRWGRATTYWIDPNGVRWKKKPRGAWERDD